MTAQISQIRTAADGTGKFRPTEQNGGIVRACPDEGLLRSVARSVPPRECCSLPNISRFPAVLPASVRDLLYAEVAVRQAAPSMVEMTSAVHRPDGGIAPLDLIGMPLRVNRSASLINDHVLAGVVPIQLSDS
jgi:hypothetical protein